MFVVTRYITKIRSNSNFRGFVQEDEAFFNYIVYIEVFELC
nr:MAG TPA: hypothetical protein [Caudoviricetes sp.]